MKPRVQLVLLVDSAAHARTIETAIEARLAGKDLHQRHRFTVEPADGGQARLVLDLRFNARLDRDDVRDWIRQQVQSAPQVRDWVLSARLETHDCRHDEEVPGSCRGQAHELWEKGAGAEL